MNERRREGREIIQVPVWIEGLSSQFGRTLSNLSMRGGELIVSTDLALPKKFALRLTRDGKIRRGCDLVWRKGDRAGVSFFKLADVRA